MMTYLIIALVLCCTLRNIPHKNNSNLDRERIQFWYTILWKHKCPFHLCQLQESFVKELDHMMIGRDPSIISTMTYAFLLAKGIHEEREETTLVQISGFYEKSLFLPKFVLYNHFIPKYVGIIIHG